MGVVIGTFYLSVLSSSLVSETAELQRSEGPWPGEAWSIGLLSAEWQSNT